VGKPDYTKLRDPSRFSWSVAASCNGLLEATGIPIRTFNLDPDAGIELYRRGRPLLREMYGPEVALPAPATPPVSYGHVNALGLDLVFPVGGEVNYVHSDRSVRDWIPVLERPVDWIRAGRLPFFLDYKERMEKAFPGEKVGLSWGHEGPMTTAYELLDFRAFTDPHDDPEGFLRFLELTTDSIVDFIRCLRRFQGEPEVNPKSGGMCDDCASMFGPALWPAFVLPAWERYYAGTTTGRRTAHVEDLREGQLPFLEDIGLVSFDPSVSARLNPALIARTIRVPFGWRLVNFHYLTMSEQDVRDWVFQAAVDGASSVFTYVASLMCNAVMVRKVHAFIDAAKEAQRMIEGGAARGDLRHNVSAAGRKKLWTEWP
jgi:hypothetical protein